jgi:hypothetical protein
MPSVPLGYINGKYQVAPHHDRNKYGRAPGSGEAHGGTITQAHCEAHCDAEPACASRLAFSGKFS